MSVVGRRKTGCFPLRGKILNVLGASARQISGNAEIQAVLKILGLSFSRKYDNAVDMATLRYGKVCILADQDSDGFHVSVGTHNKIIPHTNTNVNIFTLTGEQIAGLFLSFLHHYWPALVARGYLFRFVTPLVKVTQKRSKAVTTFYDLHAYEAWAAANDVDRFRLKYYKVSESNRVPPLSARLETPSVCIFQLTYT